MHPHRTDGSPTSHRATSILLAPYGSRGDIEPFLALGRMLRSAGAQPTFLINPFFETLLAGEGFPFISAGSSEGVQKVIDHPLLWNRRKGTSIIAVSVIRSFQRYFQAARESGRKFDLIVSGSWNVAAAAFAEAAGIPHVRAHVTPAYLRSAHDFSLLLDGTSAPLSAPAWLRRWHHWLRDRSYFDKFLPGLNEQRAACGLRPVENFYRSVFCAHGRMALLFPAWFAPSQPDWPAHTHLGFTHGVAGPAAPSAEIGNFLSRGEAPVLWTFGSLLRNTGEFEACAWRVSKELGIRSIFVSGLGHSETPSSDVRFLHTGFLPLASVLPRCRAIVHHGGIGTMAAAFEASVPQLAIPMAHDQPDNASRMARLGLGKAIPFETMTSARIAKALHHILHQHPARATQPLPQPWPLPSQSNITDFFLEPSGS